ncbi:hypothetical protein BVG19_g3504 [[Candida] boidinii]|nr:hypothetical protein BVG19_g3504 [[Candida] boidinii]OWB52762.1 hypothetical protein B5S27_g4343 [[Candida] boidinii]
MVENRQFCNAVGFFTAFSIEGADLIIICFAIHFALLIFKPNMKIRNGSNMEGGLFFWRFYIYALLIIIPIVLSSLAFINNVGFIPQVYFSYLTPSPIWYTMALSWGPRYAVVATILLLYGYIYYHVTKEYRSVSSKMNDVSLTKKSNVVSEVWGDSVWYKTGKLLLMLVLPDVHIGAKLYGAGLTTQQDLENMDKLAYLKIDDLENNYQTIENNPNWIHDKKINKLLLEEIYKRENSNNGHHQNHQHHHHHHGRQLDEILENRHSISRIDEMDEARSNSNSNLNSNSNSNMNLDINANDLGTSTSPPLLTHEDLKKIQEQVGLDVQRTLHREAMEKFQLRRLQILKQMKAIFLYPFAYILLWTFPFISQCILLKNNGEPVSSRWLLAVSGFFQAFNCTIDTIVFLVREQPWKMRIEKNESIQLSLYYNSIVNSNNKNNNNNNNLIHSNTDDNLKISKWREFVSFLPGYKLPSYRFNSSTMSDSGGSNANSVGSNSYSNEYKNFNSDIMDNKNQITHNNSINNFNSTQNINITLNDNDEIPDFVKPDNIPKGLSSFQFNSFNKHKSIQDGDVDPRNINNNDKNSEHDNNNNNTNNNNSNMDPKSRSSINPMDNELSLSDMLNMDPILFKSESTRNIGFDGMMKDSISDNDNVLNNPNFINQQPRRGSKFNWRSFTNRGSATDSQRKESYSTTNSNNINIHTNQLGSVSGHTSRTASNSANGSTNGMLSSHNNPNSPTFKDPYARHNSTSSQGVVHSSSGIPMGSLSVSHKPSFDSNPFANNNNNNSTFNNQYSLQPMTPLNGNSISGENQFVSPQSPHSITFHDNTAQLSNINEASYSKTSLNKTTNKSRNNSSADTNTINKNQRSSMKSLFSDWKFPRKGSSSTNKTSNSDSSNNSRNGTSSRNTQNGNSNSENTNNDEEDEMDLLDFLSKAPKQS